VRIFICTLYDARTAELINDKKNSTLSREKIAKIWGWMKYSNAVGIAMCAHSFKNYLKKVISPSF
jgi:hypothetical protein